MPSVPTRTPALLDQRSLGAVLEQHRVGVVDVRVHPVATRQMRQPRQAAVRPRDRQMVHLAARSARRFRGRSARHPSRTCRRTAPGRMRPGERRARRPTRRTPERRRSSRRSARPGRRSRPCGPDVLAGEPRRPGRHGEAGDREPARRAVAVAQAGGPVGHELGDADVGEGPGHGQHARIILDALAAPRRWRAPEAAGPRAAARRQACGPAPRRSDDPLDRDVAVPVGRGGRARCGEAGRARRATH